MNVGFFFPCLFVKGSVEETKDEIPCGAKRCELVSLSNRDNSRKPGKHVPCGSIFIMCCVIHYFIELIELCQSTVAVLVHYQSFILINYFNNWELWMKIIVRVWRMFAFRKQCSPIYTQSWVWSSNISNTRKSVSSDIKTSFMVVISFVFSSLIIYEFENISLTFNSHDIPKWFQYNNWFSETLFCIELRISIFQ